MRIEPFRKYYKNRVADISEFSVEIFKLKYFYKTPTWHIEWARAQKDFKHASNINDIPSNGAPLTFVNRS